MKKGPHRRFGGSKFVADFKCWNFDKKWTSPFFKFFARCNIREVIQSEQKTTNPFETRFWPHMHVMSSGLIHNFWSKYDRNTNRASFKSLDVRWQNLGYGIPLLKLKIHVTYIFDKKMFCWFFFKNT